MLLLQLVLEKLVLDRSFVGGGHQQQNKNASACKQSASRHESEIREGNLHQDTPKGISFRFMSARVRVDKDLFL